MKQIVLGSALAVIVLLVGTPTVYAEEFGHQYYWGWRDGYNMWAFSAQTHDNYSWPNDDETHPYNYWQGADAGRKYAQDHVMVKVIKGHVLTEVNATTPITDWFDGQSAHLSFRNETVNKLWHTYEFMAGYNATYGKLPPEIDPHNLAQKLSQP